METADSKLIGTFQYTPASRFRDNWRKSVRLLPICMAPIIAKLYFRPDLRHVIIIFLGLLCLSELILGAYLMMIRNRRYHFSVDAEGVTYSVNDVMVSSIRWEEVSKVNDGDPYYIKLISRTSRSIEIDYTMSIYAMTRHYISEKISPDKIRYMRFWARPMHFGRTKQVQKRPTAAPGGPE